MTYLDHAATTPMQPAVIEAMSQMMAEAVGNPSSIHQYGRRAHSYLENARQTVAESLHATANEIIFTSGGTEGNNTALISTAFAHQQTGKHLITTAVEHPAILKTMAYLETMGFEVTYLPVDSRGQITVESVQEALRPDTILVSIMFANNETGNLFPVQAIGELLSEYPALFHVDAVQAYGKVAIDVRELAVDFLTISGHKINGPKGIGVLYKRTAAPLVPFMHGGEQEGKLRAGTENLAAIYGLAQAVTLLPTDFTQVQQKYATFATLIQEQLTQAGIAFEINGDTAHKLANIWNLRLMGIPSDRLLMHLDLKGFAVSTGSACTAGNVEPSHVLAAMYGEEADAIHESIRISFGLGNTAEEIAAFTEVLIASIQRLQR